MVIKNITHEHSWYDNQLEELHIKSFTCRLLFRLIRQGKLPTGPVVNIFLHRNWQLRFLAVIVFSMVVFWLGIAHPSDHFLLGVKAADAGELERAAALFGEAIKTNPSFYSAYVNRGSVLLRSGYVLSGICDWHRARDLAPMFAYAVYTGDLIRRPSGKSPVLGYALSTELDPDHVASVMMMGVAYMDLGHEEKAWELFRKSSDLTRNPLLKNNWEYWAKSLEPGP